jgi:hypothetical protein
MSSAVPSPPVATTPPPAAPASHGSAVRDFAEESMLQTAEALHDARAATAVEINQAIAMTRESQAQGKPAELLETLARIQGHDEEHLSPVILELGNKVANNRSPHAPLVPFAGKLIAPSAFYESFDQIHKLARLLLSPVVYAEDTDSIGTASVNPVAASILAAEIESAVFKRFGIRPFLTVARLDYESWTFLTRKHFEL